MGVKEKMWEFWVDKLTHAGIFTDIPLVGTAFWSMRNAEAVGWGTTQPGVRVREVVQVPPSEPGGQPTTMRLAYTIKWFMNDNRVVI